LGLFSILGKGFEIYDGTKTSVNSAVVSGVYVTIRGFIKESADICEVGIAGADMNILGEEV
jgi:hypothetical protein